MRRSSKSSDALFFNERFIDSRYSFRLMSRNAAKLLTVAGLFCCLSSAVLWILNIVKNAAFQQVTLLSFFVGGIVLIVISLAYHTEK